MRSYNLGQRTYSFFTRIFPPWLHDALFNLSSVAAAPSAQQVRFDLSPADPQDLAPLPKGARLVSPGIMTVRTMCLFVAQRVAVSDEASALPEDVLELTFRDFVLPYDLDLHAIHYHLFKLASTNPDAIAHASAVLQDFRAVVAAQASSNQGGPSSAGTSIAPQPPHLGDSSILALFYRRKRVSVKAGLTA